MFAAGKTKGASNGSSSANYIEDVFSTYLYTGNGSTQTITNGIDTSTKGGLVWMKSRSASYSHALLILLGVGHQLLRLTQVMRQTLLEVFLELHLIQTDFIFQTTIVMDGQIQTMSPTPHGHSESNQSFLML